MNKCLFSVVTTTKLPIISIVALFGTKLHFYNVRGEFHQTYDLDEFYTDETSIATIASKENVNNQPCEFHQANNLDKLFTDEWTELKDKQKTA